jgi:molybdopterin-containing oxidoreductase family membrane subunit
MNGDTMAAAQVDFRRFEGRERRYWPLVAVLAAVVLAGLAAAHYIDSAGHHVTGMDNQIVWGLPHVLAVFLILAASGVLNVASVSSVFGRADYTPMARLSGLLSSAALAGGLSILVLDLGRPDRLVIALTYYNFKSIFAWNIFLYTGFFAVVAVYLWMMFEARMNRFVRPVGIVAFTWRIVLTTGTGSIFGFLVARPAYDAAIMAPLFIAISLALGSALFLVTLAALARLAGRPLADSMVLGLGRGMALFVTAVLALTAMQHLAGLYATEHHGVERFLLLDGGIYPLLFWLGQVGLGSVVPLALLWVPRLRRRRSTMMAAALVMAGGLAQLYVIIIGGQAYPMPLFPGMRVRSTFFDGMVAHYAPSAVEVLLALGGVAIACLIVVVAVRVLPFLPDRLGADAGHAEGSR